MNSIQIYFLQYQEGVARPRRAVLRLLFVIVERKNMKKLKLRELILSAMFLALAFVLPFFTGQFPL